MALEKWSLFFSTVISTCGWVPKNWCFWTVVLKKALSPSHSKAITPVYPKGNQPWIFTGRTYAETEALILWPPDAKSRLTGKDPEVGKDIRQEQKRMTEDEMVGWHHRLNGHEFEQVLGVGDGQGSLVYCNPWGCEELDTAKWLNWTDYQTTVYLLAMLCTPNKYNLYQ